MVLFNQLIGFATLWSSAFSASLDKLSEKNTFSVDEAVVLRARPWSGFHSMRLDYIKHGLEIPAKLEEAVNRAAVPGQTSVLASPLQGDREYNIKVQVGSRNFTLELDTGSSDM
jgi:hypothetical protein